MEDRLLESGDVKNVDLRLPEQHTMSTFSADILIDVNDKPKAIFDALRVDNKFYPESQTFTKIALKKNQLHITIDASELSQMRANINSILRLVQASYASIKSLEL